MLRAVTLFAEASRLSVAPFDGGMLMGSGCIVVTPGYDGPFRKPNLLIVDEAARVDGGLVNAMLPLLKTADGRFMALSTPAGQEGAFFETCQQCRDRRLRLPGSARDRCVRVSSSSTWMARART